MKCRLPRLSCTSRAENASVNFRVARENDQNQLGPRCEGYWRKRLHSSVAKYFDSFRRIHRLGGQELFCPRM